jgi:hypothetical protein
MRVFQVFTIFLLLIANQHVRAQQTGKIYGQLSDTITHIQLKDAYITISRTKDNVVQKSFFSNATGAFNCDNIPFGDYYLHVSYQGLAPVKHPFIIDGEHKEINLDTIYLFISVRSLDTLVIREPPMVMKKDTMEYNAGRFTTKAFSPLADLVKVLPGVQVKNDGSITINGQPIDQITVDGEPFFTGDPQQALSHLPADIVKKIQVYATNLDNKPGPPPPPGFPGKKTLNIVLKADKKKGDFGKAAAGIGTGKTYNASADMSHMNGRQQYSIVGDAGNVEKDRPGVDAIPRGGGIMRHINGGINYRDGRNEKLPFSANYSANDSRAENVSRNHTLNIFPGDSSTTFDQSNSGVNHTFGQRFNGKLDYKLNSKSTFYFVPTINLQHGTNTSQQQSTQRNAGTGDLIYQSAGTSRSTSDNQSLASTLQFSHKFTPKQYLMATVNLGNNDANQRTTSETQTDYATSSKSIHQQNDNKNKAGTAAANLIFMTPLGEKVILTNMATYSFNKNESTYRTYKFNDASGHFDQLDTTQSNNFSNTYHSTLAQSSVRVSLGKFNATTGVGVQADWLHADNISARKTLSKRFINFAPEAILDYSFSEGRSLMLNYRGRPTQMSLQQLQPVTMTLDSLFIQEGNPDLKQPYVHGAGFAYTLINATTLQMLTISMNASITQHSISQSTTLLANGAQVTKPVNIEGEKSATVGINYAKPAVDGRSGFNTSANLAYAFTPVLTNNTRNDSRNVAINSELTWNYNNKKGLEFSLSAGPGYNVLSTSIGTTTTYFSSGFSGKGSYTWHDLESGLSLYYFYNSSLPADFRQKLPLLGPVIRYRLLKIKALQLSFTVVDLLNQQSGNNRTITPTTVADSWTRTRGRYALLTVMYNFKRFGGK